MAIMVFISHSSDDNEFVLRCANAFKEAGISYWLDLANAIPPGSSYPKEIKKGIDDSLLFLLFYSCNVKGRPSDVLNELGLARAKDIMPVRLDQAEYTDDFLYYLNRHQWIDVAGMRECEAIGKVVEAVRERLPEVLEATKRKAGEYYSRGRYGQAVSLYRRCAECGDCDAQYNLGCMYDDGRGVDSNRAKALHWYLQAAGQGHVDAKCLVGEIYNDGGDGIDKDYAKSRQFLSEAADHGHARAQYDLGMIYECGRGVKPNLPKALGLYRRAADAGFEEAQCRLAELEKENGCLCKMLGLVKFLLVTAALLGLAVIIAIVVLLVKAGVIG